MEDLTVCLGWKGLRVWLNAPRGGSRQEGDIARVDASFMVGGDVDLAIRLDDGRVETVLASEKGTRWDFVK